ncbi:hypothetical protein J1N35_044044, partial [Gossypium stocksii]
WLRQSSEEALKKYQNDSKKNLTEVMPKLRSNLVLHAQVVMGPLDLSWVDFNFLQKITTKSLNLNIYNPK